MSEAISWVVDAVKWVIANKVEILSIVAQIIAVASIIVKLTPTLKDDNILLPIVKFLGKYVALNKNVSDADRPV